MSDAKVLLEMPDHSKVELPVQAATLGEPVIPVGELLKKGYFTYDPGFGTTAACQSKITYIDGNQGILLHRGYPIEQLAEKSNYLSVSYLLLYGELPTADQKQALQNRLSVYAPVDNRVTQTLNGFSKDAHPMAMLMGLTASLAALYGQEDWTKPEKREEAALRLLAQIPVLSAMCYRHATNQAFIAPKADLSLAENFYSMMFGKKNDLLANALDKIFILHADHEQNASTSAVRLVGSTDVNPYAAVTAGIAALWGAAHGGANEACLRMLEEIGDESRIPEYLARAKDKNDSFRLMGFGHRVYKNYDPRAKIMQQTCYAVLEEMGKKNDPLFKLAMSLEKIALEDDYFVSRKLYPNVDFYSGITLNALGIPTSMFTVLFALARTVGWVSHWLEMYLLPDQRIGRPRQWYLGPTRRDYPG